MSIWVDKKTYLVFYDKLRERFAKDYYPEIEPEHIDDILVSEFWQYKIPGSKKFRILEIIEHSSKDVDYFYRQIGLIKGKDGKRVISKAIGRALEYLDYKLSDGVERKPGIWVDRADELLNQFRIKEKIVVDSQSEPEKTKADSSNLDAAKTSVEHFYHHLARKDTKGAWNLLSPAYQNRDVWKGNYHRFHEGYSSTLGLKGICAFNAVEIERDAVIECMVYYEDDVATHPIDGLQAMQLISVGDLNGFVLAVKAMQDEIMSKAEPDKKSDVEKQFKKVPIRKLFDPTAIEYIWYTCGFKGDELRERFGEPHTEVMWRLFHCTCVLIEGRWLINKISGKPTHSIR